MANLSKPNFLQRMTIDPVNMRTDTLGRSSSSLNIKMFQVTGYSGEILNRLYGFFRRDFPAGVLYRRSVQLASKYTEFQLGRANVWYFPNIWWMFHNLTRQPVCPTLPNGVSQILGAGRGFCSPRHGQERIHRLSGADPCLQVENLEKSGKTFLQTNLLKLFKIYFHSVNL